MKLMVLCDASWDAGIAEILDDLDESTLLRPMDVGNGLREIVVVLMCLDLDFEWKKRLRYSRKDATIYTDIVLDYHYFKEIGHEERRRVVAHALLDEMTFLTGKYKIPDFDAEKFLRVCRERILALKWI